MPCNCALLTALHGIAIGSYNDCLEISAAYAPVEDVL
jgi:hypothetical protein